MNTYVFSCAKQELEATIKPAYFTLCLCRWRRLGRFWYRTGHGKYQLWSTSINFIGCFVYRIKILGLWRIPVLGRCVFAIFLPYELARVSHRFTHIKEEACRQITKTIKRWAPYLIPNHNLIFGKYLICVLDS